MQRNERLSVMAGVIAGAIAILALPATAFSQDTWSATLSASEWSRPRSAAAVIAMPPVASAVRAWQAAVTQGDREVRLQLVHASGEEGGLWAAELRDWLIALGVSPAAIELAPGGQRAGRLELRVLSGSGNPIVSDR